MKKKKVFAVIFAVVALLFVILLGRLIETNNQGQYQVKQAFISGKMSARMTPGTYGQWLGNISTYRAVATIGLPKQHLMAYSFSLDC